MKTIVQNIRNSFIVSTFCLLSISNTVNAEPGLIESSPLFLSNRAEPNIFFMVDDSGSMQAELMTPESHGGWGGIMEVSSGGNSREYRFLFDSDNSNTRWLPTQDYMTTTYGAGSATVEGTWRGRNSDYNALYYDPKKTYNPWVGFDSAGTVYKDVDTTAPVDAPVDPYFPSGPQYALAPTVDHTVTSNNLAGTSITFDLYPARYWIWNDAKDTSGIAKTADGVVDHDDQHLLIEIKSGTPVCANGVDTSIDDQITNNCMMRSYADEIQNFANWFTYYRSRELAAKAAMSEVIAESDGVRMGIATINQNTSNAQERLRSMDSISVAGNKRTLLNALAQITSSNSTPLRLALQRTGEYYACDGGTVPTFSDGATGCGIDKIIPTGATQAPAACQQNFSILVSDGGWNGGSPGIGNADKSSSVNVKGYFPGGTFQNDNLTFAGYEPYQDDVSNTLADVAMHYYNNDLDSLIDNKVPIICGVDENPAQHMVTFTVGFGLGGDLDLSTIPSHPRRGYAQDCTVDSGSDFDWFDTARTNATDLTAAERVDDMIHAAFNGRGEYLSAQDPQGFADSLNSTIRTIADRTGAASAVSFNANSISTGSTAYLAKFNSATWRGELSSYKIASDGSLFQDTDTWDAHTRLESAGASKRAIVTFNRDSKNPVAFEWANLSNKQKNDLRTTTANIIDNSTEGDKAAQERLNFIRGSHGCESTYDAAVEDGETCADVNGSPFKVLRDRGSQNNRFILGDMIHSAPVYVEEPRARISGTDPFGVDTERHRDFKTGAPDASDSFDSTSGKNAQTRTPMLYIGSNDGMLHAFNADTGEEIWAYIPDALFNEHPANAKRNPGLHPLTEPGYEHQYYVDLTPTVADAYIDIDSVGGSDWHTVLVGGLRAGGRGIFAIDVTDPDYIIDGVSSITRESRLAEKVMWEFTYEDDIDMGLSYSKPQIVALGADNNIEYYVVFGNGYNSHNADTDVVDPIDPNLKSEGPNYYSSKLFILKLEGPDISTSYKWVKDTNYWKINTEREDFGTDRNGLSTPIVADFNGDDIGDYAYAGDLHGFMWAFDLKGDFPSKWDAYRQNPSNAPVPLMTANDGLGNRQPVTSQPSLSFNEQIQTVANPGGNEPNLLVHFGTGTYLTSADLSNNDLQTFYTVWDDGKDSLIASGQADGRTVNRAGGSDLVEQTIFATTVPTPTGGTQEARTIEPPNIVNYTGGSQFGWFIDLPDTGERVITDSVAVAGLVFFLTSVPSQNPCDFGGYSWIMAVESKDGTAPEQSLTDYDGKNGIGDPDLTAQGNAAVATKGIFGLADVLAPAGSGIKPGLECPQGYKKSVRIVTQADGTTKSEVQCLPLGFKPGRHSWRELQ